MLSTYIWNTYSIEVTVLLFLNTLYVLFKSRHLGRLPMNFISGESRGSAKGKGEPVQPSLGRGGAAEPHGAPLKSCSTIHKWIMSLQASGFTSLSISQVYCGDNNTYLFPVSGRMKGDRSNYEVNSKPPVPVYLRVWTLSLYSFFRCSRSLLTFLASVVLGYIPSFSSSKSCAQIPALY